jgi:hypothetical protein
MKMSKIIFGLLVATVFSGAASAHDYGGVLLTKTTATDKFYIVCATGSQTMKYQVRRNSGSAQLKLCGLKSTAACPSTNNTITTATGVFSPLKTIGTGAGAYFFTLTKNTASAVGNSWTVRAHCLDANGQHDPNDQPTTVTYTQNQ